MLGVYNYPHFILVTQPSLGLLIILGGALLVVGFLGLRKLTGR